MRNKYSGRVENNCGKMIVKGDCTGSESYHRSTLETMQLALSQLLNIHTYKHTHT